MKKDLFLLASLFLTMATFVACSSEDDAVNPSPTDPTQTVTKVSIIDPIGYAQNLGAWMNADATGNKATVLIKDASGLMFFEYDKTQTAGPGGAQTIVRPFFAF